MPMSAFQITRMTLAAATITPITPLRTCSAVGIVNETGGDVLVSTDAAGAEFITLGDSNLLSLDFSDVGPGVAQFQHGQVSFYLQSAGGGAVAIIWI